MIDNDKLNVFIHVTNNLSFTDAAKQLHISQPTVSKNIRDLEQELGVQLFDRSRARPRLTSAGKTLLPLARKMIRQSIELEELMSSLEEGVVGQLRIACSTTVGKYILPQLAARLCHLHPEISITILRCTPEHAVLNLLDGEADLGVISFETCSADLDCQEFFEDSIALIVPADHPWASRSSIDPEELLQEPIIIREPTSGTRRVMMEQLAKYDITLDDLTVFLELGNAEAIVATVNAGYGISFISTMATSGFLKYGEVVQVPVAGLELRRKIYMVRKSLDTPNRAQEAFWSFCHDPVNADLLKLAGFSE
ncbi:MAG: LysR family transcriptional regulator [Chloroflexota bacterium]|nr:LysR family transcriptional regulator [Chloroflexota bacterium]